LHALYGDLPFEEQERAIMPSKDRRKIVLATNIAETSLTIEGVLVVIDSGLTRMLATIRNGREPARNNLRFPGICRTAQAGQDGRTGRVLSPLRQA
jgi:ATP-dependent helicase HrpB